MLGMSYEEATSTNMTKKMLKTHATSVAFEKLITIQKSHTKVTNIHYEAFEIQPYLKSHLFSSKEANMLTAMRSHCVRGVKANFSKFYKNQLDCPLKCDTEKPRIDTQEHTITCSALKIPPNIDETNINFIYGTVHQQHQIAQIFCSLIRSREKILEAKISSLPGALFPDQSPRQQQQHQQQQQHGAAAGQSTIVLQLG